MRSRLPLSMRIRKVGNYAPPTPGGPAAFDPTDVAFSHVYWTGGTQFAAEGYSDTDAVSAWPCEVSALSADQATGTKQPSYQATSSINSQPAVQFDGTDDFLQEATADMTALAQPNTIVLVARYLSNASGDNHLFGGQGDSSHQTTGDATNNWGMYAGSHNSGASGMTASTDYLITAYFNTTSSSMHANGAVVVEPGDVGSLDLDGMNIGATSNGNAASYCEIAFLGVFDGDVTQDPNWFNFLDWVYDTYAIDARPPSLVDWAHSYWTSGAEFQALALSDGEAVSSWPDETGTDDLAQATGTAQPTYNATGTANSQPSVSGDGTDDTLAVTLAAAMSQPYSLVAVAALGSTQSGLFPRIFGTDDSGIYAILQSLEWNLHLNHGTALDTDYVISAYDDAHLFTSYGNGASSAVEVDGEVVKIGDAGSTTTTDLAFGGSAGAAGSYQDGEGYFLAVFDGDVRTDPYWEQAESYLRWKYELFDPITDIDWEVAYWTEGDEFTALGLSDTDAVSSWPDESARGFDLAQTTGTAQPSYVAEDSGLNGKPTVSFDGTDDSIDEDVGASGAQFPQPMTRVLIGYIDTQTAGRRFLDTSGNSSTHGSVGVSNVGATSLGIYSGNSWVPVGNSDWYNANVYQKPVLIAAYFNRASGRIWMNGTEAPVSADPGPDTTRSLVMAKAWSDNNYGKLRIAFAADYDGDLTADPAWPFFVQWAEQHYGIRQFDPVGDVGWSHAYWTEGPEFLAEGYADTDAIDNWPDEVGTGDLAQATGTEQPSLDADGGPNGKPSVSSDGVDDLLTAASVNGMTQDLFSLALICNTEGNGGGGVAFGIDFDSGVVGNLAAISGDFRIKYGAPNFDTNVTADLAPLLFVAVFTRTGDENVLLNGTLYTDATYNPASGSDLDHIYMFDNFSGTAPWQADLNTVFAGIFDGDVRNDPNWQRFLDWARGHYGLPVAIE